MEKEKLITHLHSIAESLKVNDITASLNKPNWETTSLLNLLVTSKSGYDQCLLDENKKRILDEFQAGEIYRTENFSVILSIISKIPVSANSRSAYLPSNACINSLYVFLANYAMTQKVVDNLLS